MVLARTMAAHASGLVGVLVGMLLLATGCSGSDEAQSGTTAPAPATPSVVESPFASVPAPEPVTSEPVIAESPFASVPDEPVPGLDSDDPFCRAWSEFAGSFQALALASGVGADPENAIRLEVAASGALVGAVADLEASMPADVADERDAFVGGLLGPFTNRARLARGALLAAELTEEQVDELGTLWLKTIAESGSQDPDLVLVVPTTYQPAFDDAVASFSADVVPISDDPSLITSASAPRTLSYISATCPDQGTLAGDDSIDG